MYIVRQMETGTNKELNPQECKIAVNTKIVAIFCLEGQQVIIEFSLIFSLKYISIIHKKL